MTVPKRFGVLRFFGTLLKVIAWIILVLSILGAIGVAILGTTASGTLADVIPADNAALAGLMGTGGGIIAGIGLLLFGLIYFLVLYVSGEGIHLQLAVEENTRLTAALLLRMHQDGQVADEAGAYGAAGGFVSEPYEG